MGSAMPRDGPTPSPPFYPQWVFDSNIRDPRVSPEQQLSLCRGQLEAEAYEHNTTRAMLQRYVAQAFSHERAFWAERHANKQLTGVIDRMRYELEEARTKLAKVEEELRGTHNMLGITFTRNATIDWDSTTPEYEKPEFTENGCEHLALSDDEIGEMEDVRNESNPKYTRLYVTPDELSKH